MTDLKKFTDLAEKAKKKIKVGAPARETEELLNALEVFTAADPRDAQIAHALRHCGNLSEGERNDLVLSLMR